MMELNKNNISTILAMVFPFVSVILIKYLGVTIDEKTFIEIGAAIVELIILIWSAKNPNQLKCFGNQTPQTTDETIIIEDVDPASEYDG